MRIIDWISKGCTSDLVLDMTTALDYDETYSNPDSEVWKAAYASGVFAPSAAYTGPDNTSDYLKALKQKGNHGESFTNRSVNAEVPGWLLGRVHGNKRSEERREGKEWGRKSRSR